MLGVPAAQAEANPFLDELADDEGDDEDEELEFNPLLEGDA